MADAKGLVWRSGVSQQNNNYSTNTFNVDGTTDALEVVFQAEVALTITHLGVGYSSRTGTPPTYRISLQGVDLSTGNPDGTVKGGGSPASTTFTPPADSTWNSTFRWLALSNSYTVARGDWLALVVDYSSGTCDGSNFSAFRTTIGLSLGQTKGWSISNAAGTRTKSTIANATFGYKDANGVYGAPLSNLTQVTVNSNDTPDEVGLRFVVPTTVCSTYQVRGFHAVFQAAAGKTWIATLYDGTTALQAVTIDTDAHYTANVSGGYVAFDETTLSTLNAGSTYRLAVAPQETTTALKINYVIMQNAEDMGAYPMGTDWYWCERTNGGAWTDTTTRRPMMEPVIEDLTLPAGGGGGPLVGPGRLVRN